MRKKHLKIEIRLVGYDITKSKKLKEHIDKDFISQIHALEVTDSFVQEILKLRKKHDIPIDGYSFEEYQKNKGQLLDKIAELTADIHINFPKKFLINETIKNRIPDIVLANFIYAPGQAIYIESKGLPLPTQRSRSRYNVKIIIEKRVSPYQIQKFIKENSEIIRSAIENSIPDTPNLFISERDYKIIDLRDNKKKKFREIAEELDNSHPDPKTYKGDTNEDSTKTAYHDAKKRLKNIIQKEKT
ncbi:hypothetical protein JW710_03805 [Candidatus Dojkabacteria bacterium]|nr:hypothetical protein [Candidatus Dojkabacteria bacterium]